MGFFSSTPEERAEKEKKQLAEELRRADAAFAMSPAGQARAAKAAGMKIFQIDVPLSKTKSIVIAMTGAFTDKSATKDYSSTIQSIEDEGWRLEHVGYIYRITGSESRDKFMASGQQEAISGEVVGIYLFRATAA